MEPKPAPLSDLSFFRFPDLTGAVVGNIALLLLLLAVTVLVTVLLQRRVGTWRQQRAKRARFGQFTGEQRMEPSLRAVLHQMMGAAGATDEFTFVHDARAFETAAEHLAADADAPALEALSRLRRRFHLNVMNPELELVSTRQLLQDLPVRLAATIGDEKLDLYCALLRVDERFLLIDLPHEEEEIRRLLRAHPEVFLLYWREREGETVFRIRLEAIEEATFLAFRARHALCDPEAAQRAAFRLSVDLPATYRFLERSELGRLHARSEDSPQLHHGEGRVIDLSYGGASLVVAEPLEERGLAQLQFQLHEQPMRIMLEVLSRRPLADGKHLLHGQFRGLADDARARLNALLYREQIKRLRDKELLHIKPTG